VWKIRSGYSGAWQDSSESEARRIDQRRLPIHHLRQQPSHLGSKQHVAEMRRHSHEDFRDQAYRALLLIGSNRCALEDLAGHFARHPRTLNRRLKNAGTSFRQLHNRARHETARQLLRDTTGSIEAIATLLGFSGRSAFNRAFSRWQGVLLAEAVAAADQPACAGPSPMLQTNLPELLLPCVDGVLSGLPGAPTGRSREARQAGRSRHGPPLA